MKSISNKVSLVIKVVFYVIVVILILVSAIQFYGQDPRVVSLGINLGITLLVISAIIILFFAGFSLIDNPRKSMVSVLAIIGIIVIFVITYSGSSGSETFGLATESASKFIGGSMGLLYTLGIIAVLSILVSEVWAIFK